MSSRSWQQKTYLLYLDSLVAVALAVDVVGGFAAKVQARALVGDGHQADRGRLGGGNGRHGNDGAVLHRPILTVPRARLVQAAGEGRGGGKGEME